MSVPICALVPISAPIPVSLFVLDIPNALYLFFESVRAVSFLQYCTGAISRNKSFQRDGTPRYKAKQFAI